MEETVDEVKDLKGCINNLISILALPAIWTGGEGPQIVATLLDALLGMLRLDFVYVGLKGTAGSTPIEMIRFTPSGESAGQRRIIDEALQVSLKCETQTWPLVVQNGDISIAVFRLGLHDEMGVLAAGSWRTDFPDPMERLLLNVAANQATIGLKEARLLGEQRRLAEELDQKVAQRTRGLQRSEFYLQQGQLLSHCGSWSFLPSGECDYWSQELYQILGFDPARGIPTIADYLNIVHPEDREFVEGTINRMVAEGIGCDVKKRIIRPDGELRVIRCVGTPVHENGVVTRFIGTLMDITDQELMTQELRRREAHLAEAQRLSSPAASAGISPAASYYGLRRRFAFSDTTKERSLLWTSYSNESIRKTVPSFNRRSIARHATEQAWILKIGCCSQMNPSNTSTWWPVRPETNQANSSSLSGR